MNIGFNKNLSLYLHCFLCLLHNRFLFLNRMDLLGFTLFVVVLTLGAFVEFGNGYPNTKKGGASSLGKGIVKGISKGFTSSTSASPPIFNYFISTTTTRRPTTSTTASTTTQASRETHYEGVRRTYCHTSSKISIDELETAVTCPGKAFTLQLLSALAPQSANATITSGQSNKTDSISSTTITPSTSTTSSTSMSPNVSFYPATNNATNVDTLQDMLGQICPTVNETCWGKMHTFYNECLLSDDDEGSSLPISQAYQFNLYLAEKVCLQKNLEIIDEWRNLMDQCLLRHFQSENGTVKLVQAVKDCSRIKNRPSSVSKVTPPSPSKLTHTETNRIVACVKDKIGGPHLCGSKRCDWGSSNNNNGSSSCDPLINSRKNYYFENVVSLELFHNQVEPHHRNQTS